MRSPLKEYRTAAPELSEIAIRELRQLVADKEAGFSRLRALAELRRKYSPRLQELIREEAEARELLHKEETRDAKEDSAFNRERNAPYIDRARRTLETASQQRKALEAAFKRADDEKAEIDAWLPTVSRLANTLLERLNIRGETLFPDVYITEFRPAPGEKYDII